MKKSFFLITFFIAACTAYSQQKKNEIHIKFGSGIVDSKEKQITGNLLKHAGLNFSIAYIKEKKAQHAFVVDFLKTNLKQEFGLGSKFYYASMFYNVQLRLIKKTKLLILLGNCLGLSGSYYNVQTVFGEAQSPTVLIPFSQLVTVNYNLLPDLNFQIESSISLLTGIWRGGYANHINDQSLLIRSLFSKNYITSNKVSISKRLSNKVKMGINWQNYFQYINHPSPVFSNSILINNLLFSMYYDFK